MTNRPRYSCNLEGDKAGFLLVLVVVFLFAILPAGLRLLIQAIPPRPNPYKVADHLIMASDRWTVLATNGEVFPAITVGRIVPGQPKGVVWGEKLTLDLWPSYIPSQRALNRGDIVWFEMLPSNERVDTGTAGGLVKIHNLFRENPHPMQSLRL